jgi:autotransporter-associated beta strand protein
MIPDWETSMLGAAFSSDRLAPRYIVRAPLRLRASLWSTVSAVALAAAALFGAAAPARAACTPTLNPTTGQTVTCNSNQPNPVTTAIVAQPGSTDVTVNMLSGAQLNVGSGDALVLGGGGQITNSSGAIIQGVRGINFTGPGSIANDGQIGGNGGPGVVLNGPGDSTLTNNGQINGSGGVAVQFNTTAGFTQAFNNTNNGSINGNFAGSGDGGITIVNAGNFNGGITISGNGVNNITTQSGRNINGQVSISGNAQTTIVNGGAFNNGLVINGAGVNTITDQAGAFINQVFSVTGSQNTIDNAGTLNNGLTVAGGGVNSITNRTGAFINQTFSVTGSQNTITNAGTLNNGLTVGNGVNTITNQSGATINQIFSVTGSQNTITNAGTLNNGVTVAGSGINTITNALGGVINQALTVTGNPQSTVANFGTVNGTINMSGTGSVFNEGAINGGGTAINFTSGPGPFTLTLAPGFTINGNVLGTGSDTLQLGDPAITRTLFGTFNVSNIGAAQQYRGFSVFNKIGASVWALTGTGAQNWNISGGTLIGDTNSLQGPAITNNVELVFNQGFTGTYAGSIGGGGTVTIQGGGTVAYTGANTYTGGTTITGATLQLGNGGASGSIVGDVVDNGTLAINRSDTFTFSNMISGTGAFVQAGLGTTVLTANNTYAGATTVSAGTLRVSGSIAASSGVTVNAGATLGGSGTVTGRVASTTINSGGTLAPGDNAVGALVIAGNLAFQSAANYLVQVSPDRASTTFVTGSTTVAGTFTANDLGGTYTTNRIFPVLSSTGTLTGTFSSLAATGSFTGVTNLSLAYSPHEVFLIVDTGSTPLAWKAAPGNNDWNTGTNWTTNTVPTANDIAQFNASTITTINIQQAGTQVGALQFNATAPAYTFNVTGTSGVPSSLVIQGDGVADVSGNAPTFVVSGVSGALGTLQFNNASTAGDAIIMTNAFGQTIFSGNSSGGSARFITNAGGVVDFSGTSGPAGNNRVTTGSIEGAGAYNVGANTLVVGLNGLSTTVSGTINDGGISGGSGASLVKVGAGTLILSGANTYTGLTAVLGGTLQLGDGGTSGSILGNVFNATTFAINRSDTYTFGGVIVGGGAFVQMGPGTTVFTGNSFYTGGTTIAAGTLQLGNGGTSGSIIGDVVNNGILAVNRSDTLTLRGVISGTGAFQQNGIGTTVLTGDNVYMGGTTINAGTLQLGNGGASGSIIGNVTSNGTFAINRSDTYTFGGVISGTGAFAQIGPGTTILTAANSYSGGTAINAGVLAVAADANLGAASGGLAFGGGTLQFLSGFTTNRAVTLNAGGGTLDTNGNSATLAGVIGGSGGLAKIGDGTLVLAGANSYSGGTTLAGGTLRLANNSALGTGALTTTGSVVDYANGVIIANPIVINSNTTQLQVTSGTATQAGAISELNGPRPLEKIGDGTLVLSGTNSYSGPTIVSAGTLMVNGSIPNSTVTVASGALLTGTGTVGATTISNGAGFAPGRSPGTITIGGNLAFQSGALFLVQLSPSTGSSANVITVGSATLAGTVQAVFASGSYVSRSYTILSAVGGLNGTTFNALTTSNLPSGFTPNLSYTDHDVILSLTATLGQPSGPSGPGAFGTGGLSGNQRNVANALNNFFNSGGTLPPGFVTIFGLTGANLANALSQLSGEAATEAQQVAFQLTNQFLGIMLDPFVDGRSGLGGSAIAFAPEREPLPDDIALAYAKLLKAPPKPASFEQRWSVWGAGYGGSNRTSGDPVVVGSHDLTARTAGGTAGLDYHLSRDSVVGFALAGGGTDWSLAQGLGGGRSDAFQAGVYGATRWGPAYLAAAFAYTQHWMSTDRFAFAGDHLTASFNAQSFGGRVEGGYRFATVYGGLTPYAAIQAQSFHTPSYNETDLTGGGFALAFNSRSATDTRSELGARFDRLLLLNPGAALTMRARVAWAHDWVSDPSLAPVFQTLPGASFIVNGATPAKNSALTSAGAELRFANGVALLAKFDGEFASHSSTYAGTGIVRYAW